MTPTDKPESQKILIVDDDRGILELLSEYLANKQGFEVAMASSIGEMHKAIPVEKPDLIVLDIMLPDGSGLEACRELRQGGEKTPIILLTAVTDEVDRILGLEFGADDYMAKPFNPRELVARIRAVLRRISDRPLQEEERIDVYRFDRFICDPSVRAVRTSDGAEVPLTGAEFDLLRVFLDRPQRLISRATLLELTNKPTSVFDSTINVLMSRIRKKLSEAGAPDELLRTVRGGGYQLTAKVEKS